MTPQTSRLLLIAIALLAYVWLSCMTAGIELGPSLATTPTPAPEGEPS